MRTLALSLALAATPALAGEVQYQFRSVEDPAFPADDSICAQAPFKVNVKLGASLWSQATRKVDGRIMQDDVARVGRATACLQLTSFLFPPWLQQNFYAVFDLPSGRYTANGTCTITSNAVPRAGLVLAGCALTLVSGPTGVLGGAITSLSTFNPARLPGFSTGSLWTLQAYTDGEPAAAPWGEGAGFSLHDDPRSDEAIEALRQAHQQR